LFKKFDSDFKGDLDFNEFTKLIRGIAPRISSDEIKLVNIFKKKINY
jgi:Ca2+-binding EF-hand superfamily protein